MISFIHAQHEETVSARSVNPICATTFLDHPENPNAAEFARIPSVSISDLYQVDYIFEKTGHAYSIEKGLAILVNGLRIPIIYNQFDTIWFDSNCKPTSFRWEYNFPMGRLVSNVTRTKRCEGPRNSNNKMIISDLVYSDTLFLHTSAQPLYSETHIIEYRKFPRGSEIPFIWKEINQVDKREIINTSR